jgi:hypothetical protein
MLRHQLNVLRRKSPKRPAFSNIGRLIFFRTVSLGTGSIRPNINFGKGTGQQGIGLNPFMRDDVLGVGDKRFNRRRGSRVPRSRSNNLAGKRKGSNATQSKIDACSIKRKPPKLKSDELALL